MTRTPGVMVSGPVIRFELKDGRIVRKYFYDPKTKKDVELPSDFPIPGWGARQTDEDQRVFDSHHIGGIACT